MESAALDSSHNQREPQRQPPSARPSDFTIECADGTVHAHRAVLSTSSDYFRALCIVSMKENAESRVKFADISIATMSVIMDFIYSQNTAGIRADNAMKILITARYFQMANLVTACLDRAKSDINMENVVQKYYTADQYCIDALCTVLLDFMAANITTLVANRQFLADVNSNLMRLLLDSDDLAVPDEDFVFDFLTAWLNYDRTSRMRHADDLKERVRFPFLKLATVTRVEQTLGPIRELMKARAGKWDVGGSTFRRRKLIPVHCHVLWEQADGFPDPSISRSSKRVRFVLTCNVLGRSQNDLLCAGWIEEAAVRAVERSKYMQHLMAHGYESLPTEHGSASAAIAAALLPQGVSNRSTVAFQQNIPNGVSQPATRRAKKASADETTMLLSYHHFDARATVSRYLSCRDQRNKEIYLLDHETGRLESIEKYYVINDARHRPNISWITSIERGDTTFLWYISNETGKAYMTSLNVSSREWGPDIETQWVDPEYRLAYAGLIEDEIYMASPRRSPYGSMQLHKLDEEAGKFQCVEDHLWLENGCFLGVLPVDSGPPCALDTWITAEIRKIPKTCPQGVAFVELLRTCTS